jgi:geranylgeranyl pyrophosphate synthase
MMKKDLNESRDDGKNVKEVIKDLRKRSEKSLKMAKETVQGIKIECHDINEALKHYTKHWNDYVHPGLMSIACEAVGGNPDDSVPMQVVMLLLTAAADIHDDIIDESRTKYGKPTVFGKFGKDIALLVGDALLIKALTSLHELENRFKKEQTNEIWNIIFSRFFELGEAEALEVGIKGNVDVPPEEGWRILEKKASIFEAYMRIGAIVGDGDDKTVDLLGDYGKTLGMLICIREDFIDMFEPDELENRIRNEYLPLPLLYAFKNLQTKKKILGYLEKRRISKKDAERIVEIAYEEKNVEMLRNELQLMVKKACASIDELKNEKFKSQLHILAKSIIEGL